MYVQKICDILGFWGGGRTGVAHSDLAKPLFVADVVAPFF